MSTTLTMFAKLLRCKNTNFFPYSGNFFSKKCNLCQSNWHNCCQLYLCRLNRHNLSAGDLCHFDRHNLRFDFANEFDKCRRRIGFVELNHLVDGAVAPASHGGILRVDILRQLAYDAAAPSRCLEFTGHIATHFPHHYHRLAVDLLHHTVAMRRDDAVDGLEVGQQLVTICDILTIALQLQLKTRSHLED